eukprot:gene26419-17518_t
MHGDMVKKLPLFEDCEVAFILQLVVRMKMTVYQPKELVFRIGDVGHEMYFISKGTIAVKNKRNEMLALLSKGGYFGELAFLATSRRTAECVAMSYCDLSMLTAHDLVTLTRDFMKSARKVKARAAKRLHDLQTAEAASHNKVEARAAKRLHDLQTAGAQVVGELLPHHLQQMKARAAKRLHDLQTEGDASHNNVVGDSLPHHLQQVEARAAKRLHDLQTAGAAAHNQVVGKLLPHHLQQMKARAAKRLHDLQTEGDASHNNVVGDSLPHHLQQVEARAAKRLHDLQTAGAAAHNQVVGELLPHHLQQVQQLTHPQSDSDVDYSDDSSDESDRTDNTDGHGHDHCIQGGSGRDGKQPDDTEHYHRDQNRGVATDEAGDVPPDGVERLGYGREGRQQYGVVNHGEKGSTTDGVERLGHESEGRQQYVDVNHGEKGSTTDEAGSREPVVLDSVLVGSEGSNRVQGEQASGRGGDGGGHASISAAGASGGRRYLEAGGDGGRKYMEDEGGDGRMDPEVGGGDGGGGGSGGRRHVELNRSINGEAIQSRSTMEVKASQSSGKLFDVIKREMARKRTGSMRRKVYDDEAKKSNKEKKEETNIRKDLQGVDATALADKLDLCMEVLSETMCGIDVRMAKASKNASASQLLDLGPKSMS